MAQQASSTSSLGLLMQQDNLLLKQQVGGFCGYCFEACGCCEAQQEYNIAPEASPKADFMHAKEDSSCCIRFCCGTARPFTINLHAGKNSDAPVLLEMHRAYACPAGSPCTMCCCNQSIEVTQVSESPKPLGRAYIPWYCATPFIRVEDEKGVKLFEIEKEGCCPCVIFECCRQPFHIKDADDNKVGKVDKQYNGALKEMFTDADTFMLEFPKNATPEQRALLIGAVFLLDINFFESDNEKNDASADE